jgi:sigma-B regulation protein RsbU (phosphoserine phosphatase)
VRRIGEVLMSDSVSILVRDDATGAYACRVATESAASTANLTLPPDAFVVRRLRGVARPLPVTPEDLDTWERAFEDASPAVREARRSEVEALRRAKTRLLVQIRTRDQLVGVLALGPRTTRHAYTDADREMLLLAAAQLALIIENERLVEKAVTEERLRRELALAAEVQQRLFPDGAPSVPGIELAGVCQPARGVGGDYYDFIELGGGRTGIAVADVSGKGISAALVMSSVQAYLRSQTIGRGGAEDYHVGHLVERINVLLCNSTGASTYVTFFYAQYDAATRRLTYVNAGHNPPMLLRRLAAAEPFARLTSGGPVVGIFESMDFEQESIELESGDILVAYTDGVTEAVDLSGEEFGEERLFEAVGAAADGSADAIRDAVLGRVHEWSAGAPQHDDLTLVITKVH